jgi:hypothetical protein
MFQIAFLVSCPLKLHENEIEVNMKDVTLNVIRCLTTYDENNR